MNNKNKMTTEQTVDAMLEALVFHLDTVCLQIGASWEIGEHKDRLSDIRKSGFAQSVHRLVVATNGGSFSHLEFPDLMTDMMTAFGGVRDPCVKAVLEDGMSILNRLSIFPIKDVTEPLHP